MRGREPAGGDTRGETRDDALALVGCCLYCAILAGLVVLWTVA